MNDVMRYALWISLVFAALLLFPMARDWKDYADSLPVYTVQDAIRRASSRSASSQNTDEWYRTLAQYTTPHKMFYNLGTAGEGLAKGLLIAAAYVALYRFAFMRSRVVIVVFWCCLWLMRIPFTYAYYVERQYRHDFPSWADSIAIPIFSESLAWIVGAAVTSVLLGLWLGKYPLPKNPRWNILPGRSECVVFIVLLVWIALLVHCLWISPRVGSVGGAISLPPAIAILVSLLFATGTASRRNSRKETVAEPVIADETPA